MILIIMINVYILILENVQIIFIFISFILFILFFITFIRLYSFGKLMEINIICDDDGYIVDSL